MTSSQGGVPDVKFVTPQRGIDVNRPILEGLPDGPYLSIAESLEANSLCSMDATCRMFRDIDRYSLPWRTIGSREMKGLEMEQKTFEQYKSRGDKKLDWKNRYLRWRRDLPNFRPPFKCKELYKVSTADEVCYCDCRIQSIKLDQGYYLEVQVQKNADNISLAVVDFDDGGHSSVTFSPDTGTVIKETKIKELPHSVMGWYIQPLGHIQVHQGSPSRESHANAINNRFEGQMGLYIHDGMLAFFRKCWNQRRWETTGYIVDLTWAEGRLLTPCLAFRDEGDYRVALGPIARRAPVKPEKYHLAWDIRNWYELNWEDGQPHYGGAAAQDPNVPFQELAHVDGN